jgi:glycosyltransferase involved in cell wall biosynthesis
MKLSIVIPAYNEEKRIGECLRSIIRASDSKKYNIEIIVVDNASIDKTAEVARAFPQVKVVSELRKGIVWARKAGFLASTGELVANIDADTLMPTDWFDTVFTEFTADPKLLALSGPYIYYDLSALTRVAVKVFYAIGCAIEWLSGLLFNIKSNLQGGNYVVRRYALEKIGGYDTTIEFFGEDIDIGRRLNKIGKIKWTFKLPMYTSGRRLADEGLIKMGWKYAVNYLWTTFRGKPFTKKYTDIRS